jgi:SRSO17 transposase
VTFHEKMGGKWLCAVGAVTPYALQHLLDRAKWDCDEVRDVLRVYVWETLASPDAVLVIDETGGSRKRDTNRWGCNASTVVQLDASRIGRLGVFRTSASSRGHTLLDRELYLPKAVGLTIKSVGRQAHVPKAVTFASHPRIGAAYAGTHVRFRSRLSPG